MHSSAYRGPLRTPLDLRVPVAITGAPAGARARARGATCEGGPKDHLDTMVLPKLIGLWGLPYSNGCPIPEPFEGKYRGVV